METMHNHTPVCCCQSVDRHCPLCPHHGELAQLGAECPSCHQLPGRPHTDYCKITPGWNNAVKPSDEQPGKPCSQRHPTSHHPCIKTGIHNDHSTVAGHSWHYPRTVHTPGYDGPEGTEWDRGRAIVDTGTMFVDVPTAQDRFADAVKALAPTVDAARADGITEPPIADWTDDGCRCPTRNHVAACPTLPHPYADTHDDDGNLVPDTCNRCGAGPDDPRHDEQAITEQLDQHPDQWPPY